MSNHLTRIVVALVVIPTVIGIVWFGGLLLAAAVALLAALGCRELFDLAARAGIRPLRGLGMTLAALPALATWLLGGSGDSVTAPVPLWLLSQWPLAAALAPVLVLTGVLWRREPGQRPLEAAAVTLFGPLYTGVLLSALLVIRYAAGPDRSWPAAWLVAFPLVVTWVCDTFAMWGGMLLKGPRMAPTVSPGKTRSGGVSGLVGGMVAAVAVSALILEPLGRGMPAGQAALLGLLLAATAQAGDLAESLLKREARVKDSGGFFPGHGGVLDRLDSLYFVLPVSALLFRAFGVL